MKRDIELREAVLKLGRGPCQPHRCDGGTSLTQSAEETQLSTEANVPTASLPTEHKRRNRLSCWRCGTSFDSVLEREEHEDCEPSPEHVARTIAQNADDQLGNYMERG